MVSALVSGEAQLEGRDERLTNEINEKAAGQDRFHRTTVSL